MNGQGALQKEKASPFLPHAEFDSDFKGLFPYFLS